MSSRKTGRRLAFCLALLLAAVLLGSGTSAARVFKAGPPTVATGSVSHVQAGSATLLGAVDPRGSATTYYFQYGPTAAYGKQTTPASLPAGTARVKVGQVASGLLAGYHYRLLASNASGPSKPGKDRTFAGSKTRKAKFSITKPKTATVYGGALSLSGLLSGTGNGARQIVLQESPYPYLTPFTTIGTPILTTATGGFSFHVARLLTSTQYRVSTLDPRPLYSSATTVGAALRVTLKVRTSSHKGLVRLYGTVTPASVGARVTFQLRKQVRPGNTEKTSERTTKFATKFSTLTKRGTKALSRFSAIVDVRQGGSYRAEVTPGKKGAFVTGDSATVLLHSAPASARRRH